MTTATQGTDEAQQDLAAATFPTVEQIESALANLPEEWRRFARASMPAIIEAETIAVRDRLIWALVDRALEEARDRSWCSTAEAGLDHLLEGVPGFGRDQRDGHWYNSKGLRRYGERWIDREGFYDGTGVHYQTGYDREDRDERGVHRTTGRDRDGFDRHGYDEDNCNKEGFHRTTGLHKVTGRNAAGFDENGLDEEGRDTEGYDAVTGLNKEGKSKFRFDITGFDSDGRDKDGRDRNGLDLEGFDDRGRDKYGVRKSTGTDDYGFNAERKDSEGRDKFRFGPDGFDETGYNWEFYDRNGNRRSTNEANGRQPRLY